MITLNLTPEQEQQVRNLLAPSQVDYKVSKIDCIKAIRSALKDCGLFGAKALLDLFVLFQENQVAPTYLSNPTQEMKVVDTNKIRQVVEFATNLFQPPKVYSIDYMTFRGEWKPSTTYFPKSLQEAEENIASYYGERGTEGMRILEDGKVIKTALWN